MKLITPKVVHFFTCAKTLNAKKAKAICGAIQGKKSVWYKEYDREGTTCPHCIYKYDKQVEMRTLCEVK
jgi:hypothetical protein